METAPSAVSKSKLLMQDCAALIDPASGRGAVKVPLIVEDQRALGQGAVGVS